MGEEIRILRADFLRLLDRADQMLFRMEEPWDADRRAAVEGLVRGCGVLEQVMSGIMTRMWDDPFEWTLPEELNDKEKVSEYVKEVRLLVDKGFGFFTSDLELGKVIPSPSGAIALGQLLVDALATAEPLLNDASERIEGLSE